MTQKWQVTHPQDIPGVDELVSLEDIEKCSITSLEHSGPMQWMGAVRTQVQTVSNPHHSNSLIKVL